MKIVCQSCSAKYSIADDKVQGKKVFKIKCKKCGEDILVRGSEAGAEGDASASSGAGSEPFSEDEATRVAGPGALASMGAGGDDEWHAVVDEKQSGPFSIPRLKEMVASGQINAETFVWKEGFDNWKPMREVPDLASVADSAGDSPAATSGSGLFGDSKGKAAKSRADSKAAANNDLFATGAVSTKGMFDSGSDDVSSSSSISSSSSSSSSKKSDDGDKATGQRNENSVLFSLATLQQVAGADSSPKSGAKKPAAADASGLIDIKNMASALGPSSGGGKKGGVDDILSVGTGGGLASPLAAPVLAPVATPVAAEPAPPPPQSGGKTTAFAIIAVVVILAAAGLGVAFILKPAPQPVATAPQQATVIRETVVREVVNNGGGASAAPSAPASAAPSAAENPGERHTGGGGGGGNRPRPQGGGGGGGAAPSAAPTAAAASAARPASGGTCASRCAGNIDCLLRCSTEGPAAPRPSAAPASDLPESPARNDVMSAMRGVTGAVNGCAQGQTGVATVAITFASSGRVTTAQVQPPFAGTPAGSCIAREVRSATVPPFSRPTFTVNYPFSLR